MTTVNQTQILQGRVPNLLKSEDWWAVWIGFFISLLGAGQIWNTDLLGWVSQYGTWLNPGKAIQANLESVKYIQIQ